MCNQHRYGLKDTPFHFKMRHQTFKSDITVTKKNTKDFAILIFFFNIRPDITISIFLLKRPDLTLNQFIDTELILLMTDLEKNMITIISTSIMCMLGCYPMFFIWFFDFFKFVFKYLNVVQNINVTKLSLYPCGFYWCSRIYIYFPDDHW